MPSPSHRQVLLLALPIVGAQAATSLPGIVDTALMGRFGSAAELAAVAFAALVFTFLYWAFGFLRMSTTGLVAQAQGRNDVPASRAVLLRSLLLGLGLAIAVGIAFLPVRALAMWAFSGAADVEGLASEYMSARIFGAPAALCGFAIRGFLLGTGRTRALLGYELVLNLGNALLDTLFVAVLSWGPAGIGAGTAIAEWAALGVGLALIRGDLRGPIGWWRHGWRALLAANRDVSIRTIALLASFAWFVQAGTRGGTATVAGNEVLMQFIAVSAFVLDAFAFVAEKEVGEAIGAKDPPRLRSAIRVTTTWALGFGAVFAVMYAALGGVVIDALVADAEASAIARQFLPYAALVPLLGVPAWQLDGIFLGATRGRALRNAAIAATATYIVCDQLMLSYANHGVWMAFLLSYIMRAGFLGVGLPGLFSDAASDPP